jgi:hypothetical protein
MAREGEGWDRLVHAFFRESRAMDDAHADLQGTLADLQERVDAVRSHSSRHIRSLNDQLAFKRNTCDANLRAFSGHAQRAHDCHLALDPAAVRDAEERLGHVDDQLSTYLLRPAQERGVNEEKEAPRKAKANAGRPNLANASGSAPSAAAAGLLGRPADGACEEDSAAASGGAWTGGANQTAVVSALKSMRVSLRRVREMEKADRMLSLAFQKKPAAAVSKLSEIETLVTMWARDEQSGTAGAVLADSLPNTVMLSGLTIPAGSGSSALRNDDDRNEQPSSPCSFRF